MDKQSNPLPRGAFLTQAGFLAAALATPTAASAASKPPPGTTGPTIIRGLQTLLDGNARFVADKAICPPHSRERMELAEMQSPFVAILSCSDSRVPVEIIFDQAPGAIFGVRLAGNFLDDNGLGSLEYGVAVLKASLILVLGHTNCGAIKAAVQYAKDGVKQPGQIQSLVDALAPIAKNSDPTVANVQSNVAAVTQRSKILTDAVASKKLRIAGAVYDVHTGKVTVV